MAHLASHNSDTNEGTLVSAYDGGGCIEWHGDFRECVEMAKKITPFERAAYLAGLNVAAAAIDEERQKIREN